MDINNFVQCLLLPTVQEFPSQSRNLAVCPGVQGFYLREHYIFDFDSAHSNTNKLIYRHYLCKIEYFCFQRGIPGALFTKILKSNS